MACPFLGGRVIICDEEADVEGERMETAEVQSLLANGVNKAAVFSDQISYSGYLQVL